MANIFRTPTEFRVQKRAFVNTDVVPNILLGLAALLTPLKQPFHQHDWPVPQRAKTAPQDFQHAGYTTRGIPRAPFFQWDNVSPVPRAKSTPQDHIWPGFTTRGITPPPPFNTAESEWVYQLPYYQRARQPWIETSNSVAPFFRTVVTAPVVPTEWPVPQRIRPAYIESSNYVAPFFRQAPATAPIVNPDLPVPTRSRPAPFDSTRSSPLALLTGAQFRAVIRLPLQTQILARKPCRSIYDDQVPVPEILISSIIQFASSSIYGAEDQADTAMQPGGSVWGPEPPTAIPALTSAEFTVGTHQLSIAHEHSRGALWGRSILSSGVSPPIGLTDQYAEVRDYSDPDASWISGPYTGQLSARALGTTTPIGPVFPTESTDAVGVSDVWGPLPPTSVKRASQFLTGAPQQADGLDGYGCVYSRPQPSGGGQTVQYYYEADQDYPDYRQSFIEIGYTPLFTRLPSPVMRAAVQGAETDSEFRQWNSSDLWGQTPPTAIQVPLQSLPQATPQQSDQGYGLVSSYGWSRIPPASISPDKPAFTIVQGAPEHADYLQSNRSDVSGQQPPTAASAPINRTAWTDPDQKTIASQQSYGSLFGRRKPPDYFINVKMVPGEDDPEQPSGSSGHGRLWSFIPEGGDAFQTTYEFAFGTHQRNIYDEHSRGWIVPRLPPTAVSVPLRPNIFSAPQQADEGRAWLYKNPPPSPVVRPVTQFIYGQRAEDLESATLFTFEPLISPPPPVPLGPSEFYALPQSAEIQTAFIYGKSAPAAQNPVPLATEFFAEEERPDLGYSVSFRFPPPTAGGLFSSLEPLAGQQVLEQPFAAIFGISLSVTPPSLVISFSIGYQEFAESAFVWIPATGQFGTPVSQYPPFGLALFVPAELPDQSNAGGASLSRPQLPLQPPAIGPALFAGLEHRDIVSNDTSYEPRIYGPMPPSGSAPPFTIQLFSAPDQKNQADSVSGGQVRPVWQRHVPASFGAEHMHALGLSLMRLGGIQMS